MMKIYIKRATATFLASSSSMIRLASGLTLSNTIKLNDPNLLRLPKQGKASSLEVYDPSASLDQIEDGSAVIALLDSHSRNDVRKLIETSEIAFEHFGRKTTGMKRSKLLSRWSQLISENEDDIAKIMTLESGKPLKESYGEIAYGRSFLDFYSGEAIRPTSTGGGTMWPSPFSFADGSPKAKVMVLQEPIGVCAFITPWNFPLAMITRKIGPALACGCTVLLKPSELTPLTAIALHQLALRAGIPPDVFQLM
jgi:acyl-CoA reductase-like NAD-dependent aldehyde dehydrogenase